MEINKISDTEVEVVNRQKFSRDYLMATKARLETELAQIQELINKLQ